MFWFKKTALVRRIYNLASVDLAHAIGLFTYLYVYYQNFESFFLPARHRDVFVEDFHVVNEYLSDARSDAMLTLLVAFGNATAQKVMGDINPVLNEIENEPSLLLKDSIEETREYLSNIVKHIYESYIKPHVRKEALRRLASISEGDRKLLSVASAVIVKIYLYLPPPPPFSNYGGPGIIVLVDDLPDLVSAALGSEVGNVEQLFYKTLLGVSLYVHTSLEEDQPEAPPFMRYLLIFSDLLDVVQSLADRAAGLLKVPKEEEVKSVLQNLFKDKVKLKASVLNSLLNDGNLKFLSYFYGYGPTTEILCKDANVEGLVWNCKVNPFVYEYLRNDFSSIKSSELLRVSEKIAEVLDRAGYKVIERYEGVYIFVRDNARMHVCVIPEVVAANVLPHASKLPRSCHRADRIEVVVEAVVPNDSSSSQYASNMAALIKDRRNALWTFLDEETNTLYVLAPTYRRKEHLEVLKALATSFNVKFLGKAPEEALKVVRQ